MTQSVSPKVSEVEILDVELEHYGPEGSHRRQPTQVQGNLAEREIGVPVRMSDHECVSGDFDLSADSLMPLPQSAKP